NPGSPGAPGIVLNGFLGGDVNGLVLAGGNSVVNGLVIQSFRGSGIVLGSAGNDIIENCYIGTNILGNDSSANLGYGIEVLNGADNSNIGLPLSGMGNLISGNGGGGIHITADHTTVQNNFIGTNKNGNDILPNAGFGILLEGASFTTIGGPV